MFAHSAADLSLPPRRRPGSDALRVRSGVMCVAPHVPVAPRPMISGSHNTGKPPVPRRKKLKWRTRDSQSSRLYNLQLDIQDLQQQIQSLHEYREVLAARTLNRGDDGDGRYVKTVMEYHRVFENGYHPPQSGAMTTRQPPPIDARQFLVAIMDPELRIGRYQGVGMLLDQWVRYTKAQTGLVFRYVSSTVVSGAGFTIVTSRATYSHLVTPSMLELMFPLLLRDHRTLAAKLLGAMLEGEGVYKFTFDSTTHRIVDFEFSLDYVEVFARLLRDMRELDTVFANANVSEEGLIGDVDAYLEQHHISNLEDVAPRHLDEQTWLTPASNHPDSTEGRFWELL